MNQEGENCEIKQNKKGRKFSLKLPIIKHFIHGTQSSLFIYLSKQ